jgi:hypothetical protein
MLHCSIRRLRGSCLPRTCSFRYFHATTVATDVVPKEKLSLKISDPMILINNVASRYLSPSRIIIEFVDNSIDDMEKSYNQEENSYSRHVNINVHINSKKNYVRIVDNAGGMSVDTLTRLVSNIGDSSKREESSSNVNGRFGFGMQSFRAAAHKLNIVSSQGDKSALHKMSFTRDQATDISPPYEVSWDSFAGFPGGCSSGTDVLIEQWKDDWLTGYGGALKLHEQLQRHFERLLHRENIQLSVIDDTKDITYKCVPMDYSALFAKSTGLSVDGVAPPAATAAAEVTERDDVIQQRVHLPGRKQNAYIDIFLMILPKDSKDHYPVNIFCNGRRVSSVRYLKSFMRKSKSAWIWNHPNLVGYVDASCLTPVITRDEFKKNALRNKVYQSLHTIETDLSTRLDNHANKYIRSDETFQKLESVINSALSLVVREEKHDRNLREQYPPNSNCIEGEGRGGAEDRFLDEIDDDAEIQQTVCESPDEEQAATFSNEAIDLGETSVPVPVPVPRRHPDPSIARGVGLGVKFVKNLENNRRAKLVGSYIEIDVTHPDFESRVSSKNGNPRLTERLLGYIANVVSAAYRSSVHTGHSNSDVELFEQQATAAATTSSASDVVYDEMLDTIVESSTRLEEKLQKRLPALQKEIDHMITSDDYGPRGDETS